MEMAELVIGTVSLTSLFTNCVDCFEYVRLYRSFGKPYQRSLLKLDVVKPRLPRFDATGGATMADGTPQYEPPRLIMVLYGVLGRTGS
jgi:Prion-inhibition and propagation